MKGYKNSGEIIYKTFQKVSQRYIDLKKALYKNYKFSKELLFPVPLFIELDLSELEAGIIKYMEEKDPKFKEFYRNMIAHKKNIIMSHDLYEFWEFWLSRKNHFYNKDEVEEKTLLFLSELRKFKEVVDIIIGPPHSKDILGDPKKYVKVWTEIDKLARKFSEKYIIK